MKLNFCIAGVQKCGTTALHSFLSEHPKVSFGTGKETHFFDNERINWAKPNYKLLQAHFKNEPEENMYGDATPVYTFWPNSMARLFNCNPDMKIIICLRDPVIRAFSHWKMSREQGHEKLDFSTAIRDGRDRLVNTPRTSRAWRKFSYVERGFYEAQLQEVFRWFSRNQVLVIQTKELKSEHAKTLDRVCDFLGLNRFVSYPASQDIRYRESTDPTQLGQSDRAYLTELYREDQLKTKQLLTSHRDDDQSDQKLRVSA